MSGAMRRVAARHSGPFRIRSSPMTTSGTQWRQFSILQWFRVSSGSRSGGISALMMRVRTARSVLPFSSRTASILPMALRPGQSCRLPPFAPQILQPADIVRNRRDARFDAPVPAADMPARKHFLLRLGIREPELNVLVERSLVALRRQDTVPAFLHDPHRRLTLRVHRVARRRAPCYYRIKTPQKRRSRIPQSGGCEFVPGGMPPGTKAVQNPIRFFCRRRLGSGDKTSVSQP